MALQNLNYLVKKTCNCMFSCRSVRQIFYPYDETSEYFGYLFSEKYMPCFNIEAEGKLEYSVMQRKSADLLS